MCSVQFSVCFSFCSFHIDLRDVYMIINDEKFADRFLAYTHCGKYILESMMSVAGKIWKNFFVRSVRSKYLENGKHFHVFCRVDIALSFGAFGNVHLCCGRSFNS